MDIKEPSRSQPGSSTTKVKTKEFRFSLGNSASGAVGVCLSVFAETEEDALSVLRQSLEESYEYLDPESFPDKRIANPVVYFNPQNITISDIEEVFETDTAEQSKT